MAGKFNVSSSPHVRDNSSTAVIMKDVCIAMIPTLAFGCFQFGISALIVVICTVLACVLSEYLYENGDTMLDKSVREKSFSENEMKQINENFLNKYGLELYHAGEGTFAVRTYSNFYYDIFKDYLSDDYKEYLKIIVKESEEPFASDGGVIIH